MWLHHPCRRALEAIAVLFVIHDPPHVLTIDPSSPVMLCDLATRILGLDSTQGMSRFLPLLVDRVLLASG